MKKYLCLMLSVYLFMFSMVVWQTQDRSLKIIACDVGQGDAVLLMYQKTQVLIDGGPNDKVLDCLSRHLPWWDRTLEIVVNTHPEADHATGLIDVMERYKVVNFVKNEDAPGTDVYRLLEDGVKANGSRITTNPDRLVIGKGMIQIDIVKNKTRNSKLETRKLNLNSLVLLVKYGSFEALLTADIEPPRTEEVGDELKKLNIDWPIEYIKVPHHGSKNGLTQSLLELTKPSVGVISVGKNQWGHPTDEILNLLYSKKIKILRTDEVGDVVIKSDGKKMWY